MSIKTRCKVFKDPAIRRAKASIRKANMFHRREPQWIQRDTLERLAELGARKAEYTAFVALFIVSY
eukprot:7876605-Karenia_brevis.AAC.1